MDHDITSHYGSIFERGSSAGIIKAISHNSKNKIILHGDDITKCFIDEYLDFYQKFDIDLETSSKIFKFGMLGGLTLGRRINEEISRVRRSFTLDSKSSVVKIWSPHDVSLNELRFKQKGCYQDKYGDFSEFLSSSKEDVMDFFPIEKQGSGINADIAIFVEFNGKPISLFVVEIGSGSANYFSCLGEIDSWKEIINKSNFDKGGRSSFSNININTSFGNKDINIPINPLFIDALQDLNTSKECDKLIQGCCYASKIAKYITKTKNISLDINVISHTSLGIETLQARMNPDGYGENCQTLHSFEDYYSTKNKNKPLDDKNNFSDELKKILKSTDPSKKLRDILQKNDEFYHNSESITDLNSITGKFHDKSIRTIHSDEIENFIKNSKKGSNSLALLLGAPGIGKTTSLRNVLFNNPNYHDNTFFIYLSPRTLVNNDQMLNFKDVVSDTIVLNMNYDAVGNFSQHVSDNFNRKIDENDSMAYVLCSKPLLHPDIQASLNDLENNKEKLLEYASRCYLVDDIEGNRKSLDVKGGRSRTDCNRISHGVTQFSRNKRPAILKSVMTVAHKIWNHEKTGNIAVITSIQAIEKAGFEHAMKHLTGESVRGKENFTKRFQRIVFMIDEISGCANTFNVIRDLTEWLAVMNERHDITGNIIVADASLPSPEALEIYLNPSHVPRVIVGKTDEKRPVYSSSTDLHSTNSKACFKGITPRISADGKKSLGIPATVIGGNCYPATELILNSTGYLHVSDDGKQEGEGRNRYIARLIYQEILKDEKIGNQILVMLQDKESLNKIKELILENLREKFPNKDHQVHHSEYISILNTDTSRDIQGKINRGSFDQNCKLCMMTSSGTRGISFKKAKHLIAFITPFNPEETIMEFIQFSWRGRGSGNDEGKKTISIYVTDSIEKNKKDTKETFDLKVIKRKLDIMSVLKITKDSLKTRIFGYSNAQGISYVPIGPSHDVTSIDSLLSFIKELKKINKSMEDPELCAITNNIIGLTNSFNHFFNTDKAFFISKIQEVFNDDKIIGNLINVNKIEIINDDVTGKDKNKINEVFFIGPMVVAKIKLKEKSTIQIDKLNAIKDHIEEALSIYQDKQKTHSFSNINANWFGIVGKINIIITTMLSGKTNDVEQLFGAKSDYFIFITTMGSLFFGDKFLKTSSLEPDDKKGIHQEWMLAMKKWSNLSLKFHESQLLPEVDVFKDGTPYPWIIYCGTGDISEISGLVCKRESVLRLPQSFNILNTSYLE